MMSSHVVVLLAVTFTLMLALGIFIGWELAARRLRRRSARAGTAALASLGEIDVTIKNLESSLAAQREETDRARAQRDEEARKAREYFDRIDGVVAEANECRRLLVRTGAEHGNAQALMLAEIDSLAHQYGQLAQQYREVTGTAPPRPEPRMNVAIQVVAADFREAHVVPYQKAPTPTPVEVSPPTGG